MIKSATFKEKILIFLFRRNFDIWRCSIESSERVRKPKGKIFKNEIFNTER